MPIEIRSDGTYVGATSHTEVMRALVQGEGQRRVSGVTDLTDSSGGTADTERDVEVTAAFTSTAASGSNLAQKTAGELALVTVKDALEELLDQANTAAALLGITQVTNNIGGTAANGTVDAITVAVTGATTGWVVATANAVRLAIDEAFYDIGVLVNELCRATGQAELDLSAFTALDSSPSATVAALSTDTGTAADPGVSKAEADAALVIWRTNAATVAARLNAMTGALAVPTVIST